MTALLDPPGVDYAPPGSPKKRLSRGRKALAVLTVVGAVGVISGSGTFASFTASTDNAGANDAAANNPFATGRFSLANTVTKRTSSGGTLANVSSPTQCDSDGETDNQALSPTHCDVLFSTDRNIAAGTLEATVRLENTGDHDGELVLFLPSACAVNANVTNSTSICDQIEIQVQEYFDGTAGTPARGNGTAESTYTDAERQTACVFPFNAGAVCGTSWNTLDQLPLLASKITIDAAMPNEDADGTDTNHDVRFFKVNLRLKSACATTDDDAENAGAGDGVHDTTGVGCHNAAENGSAKFTLRWQLES